MKALTAVAVLVLAQAAHAAEPIERIFFTPEERARLDLLRSQKAVAVQVKDEPVPEIVKFNGIVRRNDGKATVWINNQSLSEVELRDKQSIVGSVSRNGQITLQAPQSTVQMRLKVGQSAELLSGRVDESYAAAQQAAVTTKPAPAPATKKEEARSPAPKPEPARSTPPAADALPMSERPNDANAK